MLSTCWEGVEQLTALVLPLLAGPVGSLHRQLGADLA